MTEESKFDAAGADEAFAAVEEFQRMLDECYAKMGLAIAKVADETPLIDNGVLGAIQMVFGDMLVQMTRDPDMKKKWLDHCEEFQRRHFDA